MLCKIPIIRAVSGLPFFCSFYLDSAPESVEGLPPGLSYTYDSHNNWFRLEGVPFAPGVYEVHLKCQDGTLINFKVQVGLEYG